MDSKNKKEVLDLLCNSAEAIRAKKEANAQMSELFKNAGEAAGVPANAIRKVKDYVYYQGRGMSDPVTVNKEEKEKFKDRVSPCFIKLLEVVQNCVTLGYTDLLQPYLDAVKEYGVVIDISGAKYESIEGEAKQAVDDAVAGACNLQADICNLADEIRDVHGENAESLDFVKKSDYKKVAEFFEKKDSGTDVENVYTKEAKKLDMLGEAYESIFYGSIKEK